MLSYFIYGKMLKKQDKSSIFHTCALTGTRQHVGWGKIFRKKTYYPFKCQGFSEWIIFETLKLWGWTFFSNCYKFYVYSKNAIKYSWKMFRFSDKCIWIGSRKFVLLWLEYLASAKSGLTYCPETTNVTKWHAFQLHLWQNLGNVG